MSIDLLWASLASMPYTFFKNLDRKRINFSCLERLVNLMGDEEVCVCFFVEILKTNQPKISRHLAYLRRAGIVSARREGIWMHYRVSKPKDENAAKVLQDVREWLSKDSGMQQDRNRLVKICCAPELPIQLQGSPRPIVNTV